MSDMDVSAAAQQAMHRAKALLSEHFHEGFILVAIDNDDQYGFLMLPLRHVDCADGLLRRAALRRIWPDEDEANAGE